MKTPSCPTSKASHAGDSIPQTPKHDTGVGSGDWLGFRFRFSLALWRFLKPIRPSVWPLDSRMVLDGIYAKAPREAVGLLHFGFYLLSQCVLRSVTRCCAQGTGVLRTFALGIRRHPVRIFQSSATEQLPSPFGAECYESLLPSSHRCSRSRIPNPSTRTYDYWIL